MFDEASRVLHVTDTALIRPEETFDEGAVTLYLTYRLPKLFGAGPVSFDQFPGGSANLTYRAMAESGREYVLRRTPLGEVAKGEHDMAREYRVLSHIWRSWPLAPRIPLLQ